MINYYDIVILGAGASGLCAGVICSRNGKKTAVLEHMRSPGKKLLVTGNGRCNLTNTNQDISNYHSKDDEFVKTVLKEFSQRDTLEFFRKTGIMTYEKNGYVYPQSDRADSVLDALLFTLKENGADLICDIFVKSMEKADGRWLLKTKKGDFSAQKVIFALGGLSYALSGSDGCGYFLIKDLGHTMIPSHPALCPLVCFEGFFKDVAGVRADCRMDLYVGEKLIASDEGQLQLTSYGISGIVTFQISRYASLAICEGKKPEVYIDFYPGQSEEKLKDILLFLAKNCPKRKSVDAISGLFNRKLGKLFLKLAGILEDKNFGDLLPDEMDKLVKTIKRFRCTIKEPLGYEKAQVTAGGVDISEINPFTMSSLLAEDIYFAGEIIDVDGKCGGYNLQWAWSSAAVAAQSASGGRCVKGK